MNASSAGRSPTFASQSEIHVSGGGVYVTAATLASSGRAVEASSSRQARFPVGVSGASNRTFDDWSSCRLSEVSMFIRCHSWFVVSDAVVGEFPESREAGRDYVPPDIKPFAARGRPERPSDDSSPFLPKKDSRKGKASGRTGHGFLTVGVG